MNQLSVIETASLPGLVRQAANQLANATSAAEVLDAKEAASFGYDAAKKSARLAKAKGAHDELIANIHRRQADFLEIEAMAKRRLADEYDAAQERGEVGQSGARTDLVPLGNEVIPTAADIGLTRKAVHEARQIRDAEASEPGIVRRTLDARLSQGQEPNKASLREAVTAAAMRGYRSSPTPSRRNPLYVPPTADKAAWQHVYGTARAFVEWATPENLALAKRGIISSSDKPFHELDVDAVRDCAIVFNQFVEQFDAQ